MKNLIKFFVLSWVGICFYENTYAMNPPDAALNSAESASKDTRPNHSDAATASQQMIVPNPLNRVVFAQRALTFAAKNTTRVLELSTVCSTWRDTVENYGAPIERAVLLSDQLSDQANDQDHFLSVGQKVSRARIKWLKDLMVKTWASEYGAPIVAVCTGKGCLLVLNSVTGELLRRHVLEIPESESVALNREDRCYLAKVALIDEGRKAVVTAPFGLVACIVNIHTGELFSPPLTKKNVILFQLYPEDIAITDAGFAAICDRSALQLIDPQRRQVAQTIGKNKFQNICRVSVGSGDLAIVSEQGNFLIHVIQLSTGEIMSTFSLPGISVRALALIDEKTAAVLNWNLHGTFHIVDIQTGQLVKSVAPQTIPVYEGLSPSPEYTGIATFNRNIVILIEKVRNRNSRLLFFNIQTEKVIQSIDLGETCATGVACLPYWKKHLDNDFHDLLNEDDSLNGSSNRRHRQNENLE